MCSVTVSARGDRLTPPVPVEVRTTATENLLCFGLALGVLVTSFDLDAFNGSAAEYRNLGVGISGFLIGLTVLLGLTPGSPDRGAEGRGREALVLLAVTYFAWAAVQNYFLQSEMLDTASAAIAVLLLLGALRATLSRVLAGLRRWFLAVVAVCLVPATTGQGFLEGSRVWLDFLPGRYFAFSNPNALAFLAGFAVLLAVPVLRQRLGRMLFLLGIVLTVLTAGTTTGIGVGLGLLSYFGLGKKVRSAGTLRFGVAALGLATPAMLIWLHTDSSVRFLTAFSARFDLSARSFLWASLVRTTRGTGHFWTGLGDRTVELYTAAILDVGSAHSTILQMFLSDGFLTATAFVLVSALAAIRILGVWESGRTDDARLAFALVVYWFITSLTSAQPGTAFGFALVVLLAVARSTAPRRPVEQYEIPALMTNTVHRR